MPSAELIAAISLLLNVIVAAVGLTWGIAKIRETVRDEIEEHKVIVEGKIESLRSNTGEMGAALRSKITEVELFMRDTFVRRDSFNTFASAIADNIKIQFDKVDRRLERMESKLDRYQITPP